MVQYQLVLFICDIIWNVLLVWVSDLAAIFLSRSEHIVSLCTQQNVTISFYLMAKDMEDGALLPSPTRDKLMPTIPKSKDDESYNSQRGSPKKSAISRHGSPQKSSPQKQSIQKKTIKQGKHQQNKWQMM